MGYVLLDMYEAGIFQGRSESELRAELEADYQSEMLTNCMNRGVEYIRNTLDISYSDDEWGDYEYDPDALQKKDMNHDNVVDASDFLMLLSERKMHLINMIVPMKRIWRKHMDMRKQICM